MNQQTLDKLYALRWTGLAEAYRQQMETPDIASLSFEERFALLVDQHWNWRENQAMARRLKKSRLDSEPCVEDINYRYPRQMDAAQVRTLTTSEWVAQHHSVSDHRANGHRQVMAGRRRWRTRRAAMATRVLYKPAPKLFRDLAMARADGSLGRLLEMLARTDVLVVDDFAMAPLAEQERRDFLEICDDRYSRRSTILTVTAAGRQMARADRRSHDRRQHSRPDGAQRLPHRTQRRIDEEEEGRPRMSASRLVLKQKTGWFAAGRELQDAMRLLSDSAFKLYVWLCLNADRRLGTIRVESDKLAPVLGVEIRWIDAGLAELREAGRVSD